MPASVAASAAPIERLPERHRNTTGRPCARGPTPGVTPAAPIFCKRSSTKFSLCLPSVLFHSM